MKFQDPLFLWALLVVIPATVGLFYWSWRIKQTLIREFVSARLLPNLTFGVSIQRQIARLVLLGSAVLFLLLALARPQWGFSWEEAHQRGLDILIAIDTSRSMLAQDVAPNRIEKAKLAVFDLMKQAKEDRLGLVVFAGTAFLQTPLTLDDTAFRQGLDAVNVGVISQGGTDLASAIRAATQAFEKNENNHKVLVLFTDGEDHETDTTTLAATQEATKAGLHIYTIGVGTRAGELLRVEDDKGNPTYIKDDQGNVVKSHLNETLLQQIATASGGFYLPLIGADPMQTLYKGLNQLPKSENTTRMSRMFKERYHWPLVLAMLCLIAEFILPESPRRSSRSVGPKTAEVKAAVAILLLFLTVRTQASPSAAYQDYQAGNFKAATEESSKLSEKNTNDYRLHYDAGASAYKAKDFDRAEKQFNATLASPTVIPDVTAQEHTLYNLGNTEYQIGNAQSDSDKKEERWKKAIESYGQAIARNTNDMDARNNMGFVQQRLEELKRQQQQQQQQNQKNQKNKKDQKNDKNQQNQQQQQQQDQQKQDQKDQQQQSQQEQNGQDQKSQNSEEQKKEAEQKRQQEQAKKDKEKQQQQAQAQEGKNEDKQDQQAQEEQAVPGQMSPKEARQILAEQKDDEKSLIFSPENKPKDSNRRFKDW